MGYNVIKLTLDEKPKYLTFTPSYIGILFSQTTADLSRVRIAINGGPLVPVNEMLPITVLVAQVILDWDDTENGKTLALIASDEFVPMGAVSSANANILLQQIYDVVKGAYNSVPILNELIVVGGVGYGGNMYAAFSGLTVYGTMYVSDEAMVRVWGSAVVEGGRIVITDNAKIVLSGV